MTRSDSIGSLSVTRTHAKRRAVDDFFLLIEFHLAATPALSGHPATRPGRRLCGVSTGIVGGV